MYVVCKSPCECYVNIPRISLYTSSTSDQYNLTEHTIIEIYGKTHITNYAIDLKHCVSRKSRVCSEYPGVCSGVRVSRDYKTSSTQQTGTVKLITEYKKFRGKFYLNINILMMLI